MIYPPCFGEDKITTQKAYQMRFERDYKLPLERGQPQTVCSMKVFRF